MGENTNMCVSERERKEEEDDREQLYQIKKRKIDRSLKKTKERKIHRKQYTCLKKLFKTNRYGQKQTYR